MVKKILLSLLTLVILAGLMLRYSAVPDDFPADSASAKWLERGAADVDYFDVTLTDKTRSTQANGEFKGRDFRRLKTRIWHPSPMHGRAPLIIYSHGFMSMRTEGSYLAEHLASHGYIVAAMDYPLTSYSAPGGPLAKDVAHQSDDIRFLLDQFLSWNDEPGHQFYQHIDDNRIGVAGLSLGGMTSTLAAFHPRKRDPRIAAAVSIAGPSVIFDDTFFRDTSLPFMMIASPSDPMVDYQANAATIPERVPGAVLVTMAGASHTGFASLGTLFRWASNPDAIGCVHVVDKLEKTAEERWAREIGSALDGIVDMAQPELCRSELGPAMNPILQHRLTTLAVFSFFESHFALGVADKSAAKRFLHDQFPSEHPQITVRQQEASQNL